ncbi:hypothetical protein pdam_00025308 [Pocillopora damicornis]|uniref:Uncharacterized protein n=1 Tax=Pocillopora damicornis TaxID=46731 RepID=A0A3M6U8H7_POCDA|nr:hypothetical protein pdam_00025308 [Pocillopora damicornis]
MNEREYKALKKYQDDEKSRIKKGCDNFREKIRNAPVNKGTRSISGRIAEETFELLTEKWGRLPYVCGLQGPFPLELMEIHSVQT